MEVKEIYLDMQKVEKKWKTTFQIQDERFDKPLKLKIGYEDSDLTDIHNKLKEQDHWMELLDKRLTKLADEGVNFNLFREEFQNKVNNKQYQLDEIREIDKKQCTTINALLDGYKKQKETIEKLSGTINQLEKKLNEFELLLTKQPKVFKDKIFISWNEEVMLGLYDIPDWDYICVMNIVIGEHNEYVQNVNETIIDKVHVQEWFTPRYQLYWGTDLDTPTATVYYTLLLMPL